MLITFESIHLNRVDKRKNRVYIVVLSDNGMLLTAIFYWFLFHRYLVMDVVCKGNTICHKAFCNAIAL